MACVCVACVFALCMFVCVCVCACTYLFVCVFAACVLVFSQLVLGRGGMFVAYVCVLAGVMPCIFIVLGVSG